jgi:hydrogenase maturation protease
MVNAGEPRVVIVGVGNPLRGDDSVGLELARLAAVRADPSLIAVREQAGETLALIEQLNGYEAALLADALHGGAAPGLLHRFDLSEQPLPGRLRSSSSTHAVGIEEAIELARALGRLPRCVIVYGVEGASFQAGSPLSSPVRRALPGLVTALLQEARTLALAPPGATR